MTTRLIAYANVVGRENVIAGTDCGLGGRVHPKSRAQSSKRCRRVPGLRRASSGQSGRTLDSGVERAGCEPYRECDGKQKLASQGPWNSKFTSSTSSTRIWVSRTINSPNRRIHCA